MVGGLTYGAKKDAALEHFQKALKLNPDSAIARIEYANGLVTMFGKDEAEGSRKALRRGGEAEARRRDGASRRRGGEGGARGLAGASGGAICAGITGDRTSEESVWLAERRRRA